MPNNILENIEVSFDESKTPELRNEAYEKVLTCVNADLTIDDLRARAQTGHAAGISLLWILLVENAFERRQQVLKNYIDRFGNHLILDDFRASPQSGSEAGKSGLWWALKDVNRYFNKISPFVIERFRNELTLADFRVSAQSGDDADITGLWLVFQGAANNHLEAWEFVLDRFGNDLTLADFRTSPQVGGIDAGKSGLWWALWGAANGHPELWDFVIRRFGNELTLADFRMSAQEGRYEGVSGLWWAFHAYSHWNSRPEIWEFVKGKFENELALDDFRSYAMLGEHGGISGLCSALAGIKYGHSKIWDFVQERFGKELTMSDFREKRAYGGTSGLLIALDLVSSGHPVPWQWIEENFCAEITHKDIHTGAPSALHLLSRISFTSSAAWNSLCKILLNCKGEQLEVASIIRDDKVSQSTKKLLTFYNQISYLKGIIKAGQLDDEQFEAEINSLSNQASELGGKQNKSEGFFLLAKLMFDNPSQVSERMQCYRQVNEKSIFADEAALEIAFLLATGLYDKHGNELSELAEDKREDAKTLALEEALKYAARSSDKFTILKRRLVSLLLGHNVESPPEQYSWADEMTNIVELLHEIARIKTNKLASENALLRAENEALKAKINVQQSASSTNAEKPALLQNWDSKKKRGVDDINQPEPHEDADNDAEEVRVKRARLGVKR